MDYPLVSILLGAYNEEKTIGRFLDSIDSQTYPRLETIVVDDGSSDATMDILKQYPVKVLRNELNLGLPYSRNIGAAAAIGDYFFFLDADMELLPNAVSQCVSVCETEDLDGVVVRERPVGSTLWARCRELDTRLNAACYDPDKFGWIMRFMTRRIFEIVGSFDSDMPAGEDYDFQLRSRNAGAKYRLSENVLIYHHEPQTFRAVLRKAFRYAFTMSDYAKKHSLSTAVRHFSFFRIGYLKNYSILLEDPLLTISLFILKGAKYAAAALGVLVGLLRRPDQ